MKTLMEQFGEGLVYVVCGSSFIGLLYFLLQKLSSF